MINNKQYFIQTSCIIFGLRPITSQISWKNTINERYNHTNLQQSLHDIFHSWWSFQTLVRGSDVRGHIVLSLPTNHVFPWKQKIGRKIFWKMGKMSQKTQNPGYFFQLDFERKLSYNLNNHLTPNLGVWTTSHHKKTTF